ncbi:hypothetical protein DSB67_20950 [Vibrio campbellii]|nr:hypothetical protein DSB67_20950 [Vibrio campbellii]
MYTAQWFRRSGLRCSPLNAALGRFEPPSIRLDCCQHWPVYAIHFSIKAMVTSHKVFEFISR